MANWVLLLLLADRCVATGDDVTVDRDGDDAYDNGIDDDDDDGVAIAVVGAVSDVVDGNGVAESVPDGNVV